MRYSRFMVRIWCGRFECLAGGCGNICGNGFWLSAMFLSVNGGTIYDSRSVLKVLDAGKSSAVAGSSGVCAGQYDMVQICFPLCYVSVGRCK